MRQVKPVSGIRRVLATLLNLYNVWFPMFKSWKHEVQMVGKGHFPTMYPIPRLLPSGPWGCQGQAWEQLILCPLPRGLLVSVGEEGSLVHFLPLPCPPLLSKGSLVCGAKAALPALGPRDVRFPKSLRLACGGVTPYLPEYK